MQVEYLLTQRSNKASGQYTRTFPKRSTTTVEYSKVATVQENLNEIRIVRSSRVKEKYSSERPKFGQVTK